MCMKTYDYKDEQKDVKGKVSVSLNQFYHFNNYWEPPILTIFFIFNRLNASTPSKSSSKCSPTRKMLCQ